MTTHSKHFKTNQIVYEIHTLQCTCTLILFKIWNSTTSTRSSFNPIRIETHTATYSQPSECAIVFTRLYFFPDSISQRFLERDFVHTRFQSQDKLIVINKFFVIIVIECRLRFFELKIAERECANCSRSMCRCIFINHNKSDVNDQRWQLQLFLFCVLHAATTPSICIKHWNAGKSFENENYEFKSKTE